MDKIANFSSVYIPKFDHQTVIDYLLANLPNASNQILGDAEAIFHELHFNDYDKQATFDGLVASGGIDSERFEAAYDLLVKSHAQKAAKEAEGSIGLELPIDPVLQKLGELALLQPDPTYEAQETVNDAPASTTPSVPPRKAPIVLLPSNGIDEDSEFWQDRALCKGHDPDMFYPEKGGSVTGALLVCSACTVRVECLAHAIEKREAYGVWGGSTEKERDAIFKREARRLALQNQNSNK